MDPELPNYVDDGALRDQDRVPLVTFLKRHDRAQPTGRGQPFFSGREAEINAFRSSATGLFLGEQANATVVVEGPPGAGKSALLAQYQEEMRSFPPVGANERRWLPVRLRGSRAESPQAIQQAIDTAIATQLASDLLNSQADMNEAAEGRFKAFLGPAMDGVGRGVKEVAKGILERGGGAFGIRIGAAPAKADEDMEMLANRRGPDWWDWQIVLLIDEAQMIRDQGTGTLDALHQGTADLPMSFCAFGLPGTSEALYEVGVSRVTSGSSLHLGGLDARASRMAVQRCFEQYAVTHGEAWVDGILSRSANWPQHLAAYLNAALTTLKGNAPSPDSMGDARRSSLDKAIEAGDASRASYCAGRMKRLKRDDAWHGRYAKALVSWMAREGNAPPDRSEDEIIDFLSGPPLELTKGEVTRFLNAARHAGLIERTNDQRLLLPIPSFAGHLLEEPLPPIPQASPGQGSSRGQ